MKAFVVCLFDWDYRCDCDVMRELLPFLEHWNKR